MIVCLLGEQRKPRLLFIGLPSLPGEALASDNLALPSFTLININYLPKTPFCPHKCLFLFNLVPQIFVFSIWSHSFKRS